MDPDEEFIHKDETYKLIGAGFEVYNELGCAYLELIYQEAYERELALQSIPFASQKVVVELKALEKLTSREESKIINYLKAAGLQVGLLLNIGSHPKLGYKHIVLQRK
ncbi:MAG: GxxExxY protein [Opitutaceae bacterium]|nr:GxxExxY protein [Opitutaceae bacterium]